MPWDVFKRTLHPRNSKTYVNCGSRQLFVKLDEVSPVDAVRFLGAREGPKQKGHQLPRKDKR